MLSIKKIIGVLLLCTILISYHAPVLISAHATPIQTIPESTQISQRAYRAVLVGISNYAGTGDLPYSTHEIGAFHETLLESPNWNASNILVLLNEQATKQAIFDAIYWLSSTADEEDISLFYFVGHGGRNETNERLVAYDATITDIELDEQLQGNAGELIIIIDTCYSGGFVEELGRPGRIVLTACQKDEPTYQTTDLESGIFGYYLNTFLSGISTKIETAFLLSWLFSIYYSTKNSRESEIIQTIHPMMYDGITGLTKITYRLSFMNSLFSQRLIRSLHNPVGKIWVM